MFEGVKESVKDFSDSVKSKVAEKEIEEKDIDPLLDDMRLELLQSNVSLEVVDRMEERLKEDLVGEKAGRMKVGEKVDEAVREVLLEVLDDDFELEKELEDAGDPPVVFLVGFNGSGKTTTASKLSKMMEEGGRDVVLGAGDTFRAASIEQLEKHGENLGVDVISHEYESDPAAVAYDAVEKAGNEDAVTIVDTAGRSHSDDNLMNELEKMIRVNEPDITFLIVDALSGNDVIEQAEAYEGMFDAIIVTKMDVDEEGGAIISIAEKSGKPVAFLGTGQDYGDIEEFDMEEFIERILD
ncbi:MAG: signal recognition particle receptor subunit alpha [Candidatus Nanohaloarchaea archaeon]